MNTNEQVKIDGTNIRRKYDEKAKVWYFSIVDIVCIVSASSDPRNYWKVLKSRLQKTNSQLVTNCNQLKLPSSDGKSYLTDVATSETLLEIIKIISIQYFNPFSLWFEKVESSSYYENSFPHLQEGSVNLPVDIYNKNGILNIEALIAGINPEDIIIRTSYESITISGTRKIPEALFKEKIINQELFYGSFSRNIKFPIAIEIDKIEASISHGLLSIKIPVIDTSRVRLIKIKTL